MKSAPPHPRERERLASLRSYRVLDTVAEPEFDDLAALASRLCGTPMAVITLLDETRQWHKARVGVDASEIPRGHSICAHAIHETDLLVVTDTRLDPRFTDLENLRFYAGVAIRAPDGLPLGTLCVLDHLPRDLDAGQRSSLKALARQVEALLEARLGRFEAEARTQRLHALEVLVEKTNDAYLEVDGSGIIVSVNRAVTTLYGHAPEELLGRSFAIIEGAGEVLASVALASDGERRETTHVRKDGSRMHVEIVVSRGDGDTCAVIVRDISARVEALREEHRAIVALHAVQSRADEVVDGAIDGILSIGEDGTIRALNPSAERIFRCSRADVVGRLLVDTFIAPSSRARHGAGFRRTVEGDTRILGSRIAVPAMRADGTEFRIELTIVRPSGQRDFTVFIRDLTQQQQAEEQVFASSELFRHAFDRAAIGMALVEMDGTIERANAAMSLLLGVPLERIVGHPVTAFVDEDALERVRALLPEVLSGARTSMQLESKLSTASGARAVVASVSVVKDSAGHDHLFAVQLQDITARRVAEAEMVAAKEAAESANRAKSAFLGNMSHELRTPLNAILGFGRVLELARHGPLNTNQAGYVRDIIESGSHMLVLVEELLELRSLEDGLARFVVGPMNLRAAFDDAVRMTRELVIDKKQALEVDEVAATSSTNVIGDHRAVVQVLVNLVSNAIKYTPAGGHLRLSAEQSAEVVTVHVQDDGVGLDPEEQRQLFREFARLGRREQGDAPGTGLGLAITRRLVEALGGVVSVESTKGLGSRFSFTLRRAASQELASALSPS